MITLSYESCFPVPVETLFSWHETPGAFSRLNPPFEPVELLQHTGGIKDGAIVKLKIPPPFYLPKVLGFYWTLTHKNYQAPFWFEDHQLKGPFKDWRHSHIFEAIDERNSRVVDKIEFSLPFGFLTEFLFGWIFKSKLNRLFSYRHRVTKADLEVIEKYRSSFTSPQRIVVSGASGLVGQTLVNFLKLAGHTVFKLERTRQEKSADSIFWDPYQKIIEIEKLSGIDHVIHLAGENVGQRWTTTVKNRIVKSRVETTRFLVETIKSFSVKPRTFICASASGYYGTNQLTPQDESCPKGDGFLSDVVKAWEDEALSLENLNIRVCHPRISVVLSPEGGALSKLLPPFLLGFGGPVGNGRNFMSCIAKDDLVYAIYHLLCTDHVRGPVNMAMPQEAPTNKEFSVLLAKIIKRPCLFAVPKFVLKIIFGEMAKETILSSTNISSEKISQSGFKFKYPTLESALRHCLGK